MSAQPRIDALIKLLRKPRRRDLTLTDAANMIGAPDEGYGRQAIARAVARLLVHRYLKRDKRTGRRVYYVRLCSCLMLKPINIVPGSDLNIAIEVAFHVLAGAIRP